MELVFWVDGVRHALASGTVSSSDTILSVLRRLGHCAVKEGCGEGGCGVCSVLVSWRDKSSSSSSSSSPSSSSLLHRPVSGCLTPAFFLHLKHVSTARSCASACHALSTHAAVQCGFCSPGASVLLTAAAVNDVPDIESLDGLLCRCTGYRPIVASRRALSTQQVRHEQCSAVEAALPAHIAAYDSEARFECSDGGCWIASTSLSRLLQIMKDGVPRVAGGNQSFPKPQLVLGSTDLSYHERYHHDAHVSGGVRVSPFGVPELRRIEFDDTASLLRVGSAASIEEFRHALCERPNLACFAQLSEHLKFFGNMSVRSMGTIGGSIVACDPLSDLLPPLRVLRAQLVIVGAHGQMNRKVDIGDFVDTKRGQRLDSGEILLEILVPLTPVRVLFKKVSKRKTDAQALLSVAFSDQLACASGLPGHGPAVVLDLNALRRFLPAGDSFRFRALSALARRFKDGKSVQPSNSASLDQVGHDSSSVPAFDPFMTEEHLKLAQGKLHFVADIPAPVSCFFGAFVLFAGGARATNLHLDTSLALSYPGVVSVATAADVANAEHLRLGTVVMDEEVFASKDVHYFGQPVAMVVARTMQEAREAARLVVCKADLLEPVQGLRDALEKQSFFSDLPVRHLVRTAQGDTSSPSLRTVSGTIWVGGQEHLYLEPQACTVDATFGASGGRETVMCYAACQNPSRVQWAIARVLDIPMHDVRCVVPRIGGGFGGKQDRPQFIAAAAAIASHKVKAPVRVVLEREEDMVITGQRHPFCTRFVAKVDDVERRIVSLEADIFADGGFSVDLSLAVLEVFMFSMDGAYYIDDVRLTGRVCRTNRPSNTAFRGFGKPQGAVTVEKIFELCAAALRIRPDELRQRQVYRKGDALLSRFPASDGPSLMLAKLLSVSDYHAREAKVREWNAHNKEIKRGIAFTVIKNNTGFDVDWMNQASTLVIVYRDGTVLVSCAGVEMGQGLRAKMRQIVAGELGIDQSFVRVGETDTAVIANSSPTAATTGTDLNGKACIDACRQIRERLHHLSALPWADRCRQAYEAKISLQATGYHAFENFAYSFEEQKGDWSYYYIYGACASEVQVDLATGEFTILRTDIVQEVGKSLNSVIDLGQIEGGFMQGVGLYTMEELVWATDGHLRSRNVSTYKIPAADDVPKDFRIHLVESDASNERGGGGVLGSKTVGEAGVQHATSVWLAISRAVGNSDLTIPATIHGIERAASTVDPSSDASKL